MARTLAAPKLASEICQTVLGAMATSKAQAWTMEIKQYYDGIECGKGHLAIRARSTGRCMECNDISRAKNKNPREKKAIEHFRTIMCFGQPMMILSSAVL